MKIWGGRWYWGPGISPSNVDFPSLKYRGNKRWGERARTGFTPFPPPPVSPRTISGKSLKDSSQSLLQPRTLLHTSAQTFKGRRLHGVSMDESGRVGYIIVSKHPYAYRLYKGGGHFFARGGKGAEARAKISLQTP